MNRNAYLRRRLRQMPPAWFSPAQRGHRSDTRLHWHVPMGHTEAVAPKGWLPCCAQGGAYGCGAPPPRDQPEWQKAAGCEREEQLPGKPRHIESSSAAIASQVLCSAPSPTEPRQAPATLHQASAASRSGVMGSISRILEPSAKNVSGFSRACVAGDRGAWLPFEGGAGSGSVQWRWQWRPWEKTCEAETHGDLVEMAGVIGIIRIRIELVAGLGMHLRRGQGTARARLVPTGWVEVRTLPMAQYA